MRGETKSDRPRSVAVARRTVGVGSRPAVSKSPAPVQVRMSGAGLGDEPSHRARKRLLLLLAGSLASAAVGLMLGRMQQSPSPAAAPPTPTQESAPQATPRSATDPSNTQQPPLVRPRTARELVLDGDIALEGGQFDEAARLYTRALAVLAPNHPLAATARFRRADALRELGRVKDATAQYWEVLRRHPNAPEAQQARLRLRALSGGAAARRTPTSDADPSVADTRTSPAAPGRHDDPPPPLQTPAEKAEAACRQILTAHLQDARAAIGALERMQRRYPDAPCVYWNLGRKYESIQRHREALDAYKIYLSLAPTSRKAPAVQRRVTDLQQQLREPIRPK